MKQLDLHSRILLETSAKIWGDELETLDFCGIQSKQLFVAFAVPHTNEDLRWESKHAI